ncbi:hypothetical protein CDV55_100331 [Aspergillus turcosus]|uniref:Uncharacterized protein n=1 Tax=Aspergillus turcosus TaxID=1245748 RepID=A0A229WUS9_9EURO|nr:hypothetical protein CDV55_100331 [Aspergillus turcosus]RLL93918.1 hypothetical protein CFD26_102772 [Aspergillus turcosus]
MSILLFLCLAQQTFAQTNSTVLEGWQLDGSDRSSWDILWTCLSTILACTWTALHVHVFEDHGFTTIKSLSWIAAILGPELMAFKAVQEFWEVKHMVARCNSAQLTTDSGKRTKTPAEITTRRSRTPWTLVQGFCIRIHGLVLQTKDNWRYTVRPANAVALIEAGVIKQCDLRDSEIKDRAKADSFAKAITLLQITWVTCNVLARAAYDLPISAIEISTVAYVVCAVVAYAAWWHKPKDMNMPIVIHLPYDRDSDEMPPRVRSILDPERNIWIHLPPVQEDSGSVKEDSGPVNEDSGPVEEVSGPVEEVFPQNLQTQKTSQSANNDEEASGASQPEDSFIESLTIVEQLMIDVLTFISALIFCGIHIAA